MLDKWLSEHDEENKSLVMSQEDAERVNKNYIEWMKKQQVKKGMKQNEK